MKIRHSIADILVFLLVLDLFFEGIWKVAFWRSFSVWIHYAPFLKPVWAPLAYAIPTIEIATAISLLLSKLRQRVLVIVISLELCYILWIALFHAFSHRLCWPYQELWKGPTWIQEAVKALSIGWLALISRLLYKGNFKVSLKDTTKEPQFLSFERHTQLRPNNK